MSRRIRIEILEPAIRILDRHSVVLVGDIDARSDWINQRRRRRGSHTHGNLAARAQISSVRTVTRHGARSLKGEAVTGGRQHADGARQNEPTMALEDLHAYTLCPTIKAESLTKRDVHTGAFTLDSDCIDGVIPHPRSDLGPSTKAHN